MNRWLDIVADALDGLETPAAVFFRDDDAGWEDDHLVALMDRFHDRDMPLDLAAIPTAVSGGLAAEIRRRVRQAPSLLGVHQHGYCHANHETEGRKGEFGTSRGARAQAAEIEAGATLLADALGLATDPIFTPPWNRCTADTVCALEALGFAVLSRDSRATALQVGALVELPVSVDWCKLDRDADSRATQLGPAIAAAIASAEPCGIMFHHAVMDEAARRRVDDLLGLLAAHGRVRTVLMRDAASSRVGTEAVRWRPSARLV